MLRASVLAPVMIPVMMLAMLAIAAAQDAPQPRYPPGFDCAALPAGAEREACEAAQLIQKPDGDAGDDRSPAGAVPATPGSVSPPTIPDEPGGETRGSGPGTEGGAGGVGN